MESPWPCNELELGPSSRRRCLPSFFCDALLGVGMLEAAFSSTQFLSIGTVGSELWTSLHEYIDCGTHRRTPNNSSAKLHNFRVLDYEVGCLVEGSPPPHRYIFSWSLPLALKLGKHFMSTSMVTLPREFSITRPASRAMTPSRGKAFCSSGITGPVLRTINIKIF